MKYTFAIATTTYFGAYNTCLDGAYRKGLFLKEAASLARSDFNRPDVVWVIYDDASPMGIPELPKMECAVEIIRGTERILNIGAIPKVLTYTKGLAPLVMSLDSDGLISRDCHHRIQELITKFPEKGVFGTFNTKYHPTISEHNGYVLKYSLCEHGLVFKSNLWVDEPKERFGLLSNVRYQDSRPYPCLFPSGVQHTGIYGLNGTKDDLDPTFTEEPLLVRV